MPVIRLFPFLPLTDAMRPSQPRVAFDVPESSRFQFSVLFFVGLFGVKLTRKEVSAMIDFFQGCEQELGMDAGGGLFPVLYRYSQNDSVLKRICSCTCAQCRRAVFRRFRWLHAFIHEDDLICILGLENDLLQKQCRFWVLPDTCTMNFQFIHLMATACGWDSVQSQ